MSSSSCSSNSSSNHFHLMLPSNASMDIYANNTTAQYVTKLPRCIELNGDWSISLKEISTPLAFDNVVANYYKFTLKANEMEEAVEKSMQEGNYLTKDSIIDELNRLLSPCDDIIISFRLVTHKHTVRVRLMITDTFVIRMNRALSNMLGMGSEGVRDLSGIAYTAPDEMHIPSQAQTTTLYVYCNILEHVIVGDTTAPLLQIVESLIYQNKRECMIS